MGGVGLHQILVLALGAAQGAGQLLRPILQLGVAKLIGVDPAGICSGTQQHAEGQQGASKRMAHHGCVSRADVAIDGAIAGNVVAAFICPSARALSSRGGKLALPDPSGEFAGVAGEQGTIGIKQIGLWRAVDAELKSQFAVGVGQYGAIGVARLDKPGAGRIPFVAIVETVEGHCVRELAEQRMFGAAVGAPAGPDVKDKGLPP